MNIETIREYCISKKGVSECFPFDEVTLVFKVMGKMFVLMGIDNRPLTINLKCEPELAVSLREEFPEIVAGFHMNKKHWNTIYVEGNITEKQLNEWIDISYNLVAGSLTKKLKEELYNL